MSMNKERFVRCVAPLKPGRFRDAWAVRQARAEAQKVYLQMKLQAKRPADSTGLSAEVVASLRRDVYGLKE